MYNCFQTTASNFAFIVGSSVRALAYDQHQRELYYARSDGAIHKISDPLETCSDEFVIRTGDPRELVFSYCGR